MDGFRCSVLLGILLISSQNWVQGQSVWRPGTVEACKPENVQLAPITYSTYNITWECYDPDEVNEFQVVYTLINKDGCNATDPLNMQQQCTSWGYWNCRRIGSSNRFSYWAEVTNLYAYSTYQYFVKSRFWLFSYNITYNQSMEVSFTTGEAAPIASPGRGLDGGINVDVQRTATSMTFTFNPILCGSRRGDPIYEFSVETIDTGEVIYTTGTQFTQQNDVIVTIVGFECGTRYRFMIRGSNGNGELDGPFSDSFVNETSVCVTDEDGRVDCAENEYECADGEQCILAVYRCDYYRDCSDNSDEVDSCVCDSSSEFECVSGGCILKQNKCDGFRDCFDSSDEAADVCSSPTTQVPVECAEDEYKCADGQRCIFGEWKCDYFSDCDDNSDEMDGCVCDASIEFECASGSCTNATWICDGEQDCFGGSDEAVYLCSATTTQVPGSTTPGATTTLPTTTSTTTDAGSTTPIATTERPTTTSITTEFPLTTEAVHCETGYFLCSPEGPCIEDEFVCDSLIDCRNTRKDEIDCPCTYEGYFRCDNTRCIAPDLRCNEMDDCGDNSDERNCPCDEGYFRCSDDGLCLQESFMCDDFIDCTETYKDERDCPCPDDDDFRCANVRCIPSERICNGVDDCRDMSDEIDCSTTPIATTERPTTTSITTEFSLTTESGHCDTGYFPCSSEGPCIDDKCVCDSVIDCLETKKDEIDCPCTDEDYFRCDNIRCIAPDRICNEMDDCGDNSDERNCSCQADSFACSDDGPCIEERFVCDDFIDCIDTQEDERDCPCPDEDHFRCANRRCIPSEWICNGEDDCQDMSDEIDCSCGTGYFSCSDDGPCIVGSRVCDAFLDCTETAKDELECPCPKEGDIRCSNARCITPHLMCDGVDHCGDNSDETTCATTMQMLATTESPTTTELLTTEFQPTTESDICDTGQFPCSDDGPCIDISNVCDAYIDCTETKRDEIECQCPREGDVRCENLRCIPPALFCDGKDDCRDNSDESNCEVATTESSTTTEPCGIGYIPCSREGPCIEFKLVCDGYVDCIATKRDEMYCPCLRQDDVRCTNLRCIHSNEICDGKDDCGDNYDERNCP
ncbi:uncharacterized protein [Amphiura filiformis]|uniref:uncharacterized protein n=1 Tax=Amphiura filiformis TaxID=82378 RepID=UPI003B219EE7